MYNDKDLTALQSLLSCDTLDSDIAGAVSNMVRKEKEKRVLQVHKYKISGPFGKDRVIYTTRCPWVESKKVNRKSYDDLIDYLFEHYFVEPESQVTVREVYELMIKEYEETHILSELTLAHYKADWNKNVVGKGAKWLDKPIANVTSSHLYAFYRTITAGAAMRHSTFCNVKTVINAVFDYAITMDIPCIKASHISTSRLPFAPVSDKWEGVYTTEDRKKILTACENARPTVYTKAIELMFCLDIRIGELRALQKEDVDLENKKVRIAHQMVDVKTETVNRHAVRSDIMKGKRDAGKRVAPLSDRAIRVITWLNEHYPDTVWLLPNQDGLEPIYTNRFNENLKKICKQAGVKYFSSHGIRFHNISALYDAGINEKEIQRLSGHTTSEMTRHYNRRISNTCDDEIIRAVLG